METTQKKPVAYWWGFFDNEDGAKKYPAWRYHKILEPIIVKNDDEDEEAKKRGFEAVDLPVTANRGLINWFWDIEDLSPRQLVVYAKEEWDIDLPIEAGQERLQAAIFKLIKWAPNNRGRLVFMAHEIKMDLDAVQKEIRDLAKNGMTEVESRVIEL